MTVNSNITNFLSQIPATKISGLPREPIYDQSGTILADQGTYSMGMTLANTASQKFSFYMFQTLASINQEFVFSFICAAGHLYIYPFSVKKSTAGIVHYYLDDVDKGNIDFYSASPSYNHEQEIDLGTVSEGLHTLKTKVESKNASSSGYEYLITAIDWKIVP